MEVVKTNDTSFMQFTRLGFRSAAKNIGLVVKVSEGSR